MFKHILLVGIAAPALVLACTTPAIGGPSQLIRKLRAGESQRVLTYGTSLTFSAWPDQLNTWLAAEFPGQVELINKGVPSSATHHTNPALDALVQLNMRVLSNDPDTVFIEFAINDALTGYDISPQQSRDNLNTMIDRILADRPDREIILMTMNPAWDSPTGGAHASFRPNLAEYYQGYRDVAAQRGLLLIDHYANWIELRDHDPALFQQYIPDGVHPTAEALLAIVNPEIIRALTVPEPAISTLLSLGAIAGFASYGRRRRSNASVYPISS